MNPVNDLLDEARSGLSSLIANLGQSSGVLTDARIVIAEHFEQRRGVVLDGLDVLVVLLKL